MTLPARSRLFARLAATAAFLIAAYLVLIPRTVVYFIGDDGQPYHVDALYSWGTGGGQILSGNFADWGEPGGDFVSVRAGCGTAFTSGPDQRLDRTVPEACSAMETPRRIGAGVLLVLGIAGLVGATRLPEPRFEDL